MEVRELLAGIAVVIDDALGDGTGSANSSDRITQIVKQIEDEWNLPMYKTGSIPPENTWPNLLQAASFILLDWQLWPSRVGSELEKEGIRKNIKFLEKVKNYLVPVFIFTNESTEDIEDSLSGNLYTKSSPESNFIFIRKKIEIVKDEKVDFGAIDTWIESNASVYSLKTWDQTYHAARKSLFSSMYARNPDWPKVFWEEYKRDNVDPSYSLTNLISDILRGRMQTDRFEDSVLERGDDINIPKDELRSVIGEASFRRQSTLPPGEVGCGDMFHMTGSKYLLNLRPDCDCIPRDGESSNVELYCIEGKRISESELDKMYDDKLGNISERIWESVVLFVDKRVGIRFDFRKFKVVRFSELKDKRAGRLIHPWMTKIQQRYALYLQRQGLPRVPERAIKAKA